jgi:hypothetical protein
MQGYGRRTRRVLQVAQALLEQRPEGIRPGDINARLRAEDEPMGAWEVRGELSRLERSGELALDPATARWRDATTARRSA